MGQIQNYRQPMVTATGIFLGFLLNFGADWIHDAFTKHIVKDIIVGTSMLLCLALLIIVLFRMLNMRYHPDREQEYYQKTLWFFLSAITLPFISFVLVIIHRLITRGTQ